MQVNEKFILSLERMVKPDASSKSNLFWGNLLFIVANQESKIKSQATKRNENLE